MSDTYAIEQIETSRKMNDQNKTCTNETIANESNEILMKTTDAFMLIECRQVDHLSVYLLMYIETIGYDTDAKMSNHFRYSLNLIFTLYFLFRLVRIN
jgi:hypothetical protein